MKFSLRNKLIVLIEIAVISVALIVGITSYFVIRKVFEKRIYAQLESIAVLKIGHIRGYLDDMVGEIEYIANSKTINGQMIKVLETGSGGSTEELRSLVMLIHDSSNKFSELLVLNNEGEVVFATAEEDEGKIKVNEPYFTNSKEKTFVQELSYDISAGASSIMVGTPVKNPAGEVVGVLVGRGSVDQISSLIVEKAGLGVTGESFLVNSGNVVINEVLKEPGMALKMTIYKPQVVRCLAGETFSGQFSDYHNDLIFGSYYWLPEIRSCIVTKIDVAEALISIQSTYILMFALSLGIALFAGVGGFIFGNRLFKPLQMLQDEVQKINEGNFDVKVNIKSNDEIGEVAQSFKEMASKLKVSYENLEDKVTEKTKSLEDKLEELEKMNDLMVGRELTMIELKEKLKEKEKK